MPNACSPVAETTSYGGFTRLELDGLSMIQYPANELEPPVTNLILRRRIGERVLDWMPLLRPGTERRPAGAGWTVAGIWRELAFSLAWLPCDDGWSWTLSVRNGSAEEVTVDVVYRADVALTDYAATRRSEAYVSQYLDLTPIGLGDHGVGLGVRQNMPGPRNPWLGLAADPPAVAWATDAHQLVRNPDHSPRDGLRDDLPSVRLQHEHTLAALQCAPQLVAPGQAVSVVFAATFDRDHPTATEQADAARLCIALDGAVRASSAVSPRPDPAIGTGLSTAFHPTRRVVGDHLDARQIGQLFGADHQHEERSGTGELLSWFDARGGHVVTRSKGEHVLRPHGHILRTGSSITPDESQLTSTVWMNGVFHSHVTQGHVAANVAVSARRSYLDLCEAHGLRGFVRFSPEEPWRLLHMPSAFRMSAGTCEWVYATGNRFLRVVSAADTETSSLQLAFEAVGGGPVDVMFAAHIALDDDHGQSAGSPIIRTVAGADSTIATVSDESDPHASMTLHIKRADQRQVSVLDASPLLPHNPQRGAGLRWVTVTALDCSELSMRITADLLSELERSTYEGANAPVLRVMGGLPQVVDDVAELNSWLPWLTHDAVVHYLAPRGLEQLTGGAWGTRDVCQGPAGLLLAADRFDVLRDLVVRVFAAQQVDGSWPQWFDFFARHMDSAYRDSHGDVVYWPILLLADYLASTGDHSVLRAPVGVGRATLEARVHLALDYIDHHQIDGYSLPAYGHGDWNDSLQPADPHLAAHLCSSWTTVLQIQALDSLGRALGSYGDTDGTVIRRCLDRAADTRGALQTVLVQDEELPGYMLIDGGRREPLVHPADARTGLHHGILQMIHAISADVFTPEQAGRHLAIIAEHLLGPDGARLFDLPVRYSDGPLKVFRRAEAATFWGREIGLMYTHAHVRYIEALARAGDADGAWEQLLRIDPIGMAKRVPRANLRQSNTYFSSSDAAFADRQDAEVRYADFLAGNVAAEGGWRIYSSGPGLLLRIIREQILGVRTRAASVEFDPVLPASLTGMSAEMSLLGEPMRIVFYHDDSVDRVTVRRGETTLESTDLSNPYRRPGVSIPVDVIAQVLSSERQLEVIIPS